MIKWFLITIGIIIIAGITLIVLRGQEDTWIKDSRGVWVKHGNPKNKTQAVITQEEIINKVSNKYQQAISENKNLNSGPCLGQIQNDWVLDVVHNPRIDVDNQPQNQCEDFIFGKAKHFVEIDTSGNIIQIK